MKKPSLKEKEYMRVPEAVALYGLSWRKMNRLLEDGEHDFLVFYGTRKLILREPFEAYLSQPGVMEGLKVGKKRF
jgi:hypothetical protein